VLVIGRDEQAWKDQNALLLPVLDRDYESTYDNGYVTVYSRKSGP
jgi:hypothetical protein